MLTKLDRHTNLPSDGNRIKHTTIKPKLRCILLTGQLLNERSPQEKYLYIDFGGEMLMQFRAIIHCNTGQMETCSIYSRLKEDTYSSAGTITTIQFPKLMETLHTVSLIQSILWNDLYKYSKHLKNFFFVFGSIHNSLKIHLLSRQCLTWCPLSMMLLFSRFNTLTEWCCKTYNKTDPHRNRPPLILWPL